MTTRRLSLRSIAPLAALILAVYPFSSANAEAMKGAEALTKRAGTPVVHNAATSTTMKCDRCADKVVTIPDRAIKGAGAVALSSGKAPQQRIVRHTCPDCGAKLEIKGHGKASTTVMAHQCGKCAPAPGTRQSGSSTK